MWAMCGILMTVLALGCFGAGASALPGHAYAGTANASPARPGQIIDVAWMY
jgi:hypothetical protein